jgi:hypothetical protein
MEKRADKMKTYALTKRIFHLLKEREKINLKEIRKLTDYSTRQIEQTINLLLHLNVIQLERTYRGKFYCLKNKEEIMTDEKYISTMRCDNCGALNVLEIPMGTRIDDVIKKGDKYCESCRCLLK